MKLTIMKMLKLRVQLKINFPSNIDDLGNWTTIEKNIRDLLVERGPKSNNNIIFPKDHLDRCFAMNIIFEIYQMGRSKIESDWCIQFLRIKSFAFVVNYFQRSI